MISTGSRQALIVAAESSSALYAQRLLEHWAQIGFQVQAFGIGSEPMAQLGFEVISRSEDLAVVGLQEVISHWPMIWDAFHKLLKECEKRRPQVAVLLDYPDFNLRLARRLKKMGIPVVYYISPQIWAWRQSRVHVIRQWVNKMLVVFPFEKSFYQKFSVPVEFVGHPLLDEISSIQWTEKQRSWERGKFGILSNHQVIGLMPGSRKSELKHNLPHQLAVAKFLLTQRSDLKIAILLAPGLCRQDIEIYLAGDPIPLIILQDTPFRMIRLADCVLCASGTATLMVGLTLTPLVIMYRMNPLTAWVAIRWVRNTPYFGMVNLILEQKAVPEFFQNSATVENLAQELLKYLTDSGYRAQVINKLSQLSSKLGNPGATVRVAHIIQEYLESSQSQDDSEK